GVARPPGPRRAGDVLSPHPLAPPPGPPTIINISTSSVQPQHRTAAGGFRFIPPSYQVFAPEGRCTEVPPMGTDRTSGGSASPAGRGKTGLDILVVEDHADTAATLALVLGRE